MANDHNFKVKKGLDVLGGDVNLGDGFAYKIDGTTVINSSRTIAGTYFLAIGGDSTPAGTTFSNVFKGSNARTAYFDSGDGSAISTWYGSGNTPFAAIDANNGVLRLYVNNTSGSWQERIQMNSSGITNYGTTKVIATNVHLESTSSAYYRANGANNQWKYLSLQTGGSTNWDIATKNNDLSGALQFRPNGGPTNRTYMDTSGNRTMQGEVQVTLHEFKVTSSNAYTTHLNYQNNGQNFISQATSGGLTQFRNSDETLMEINSSGNVSITNDLTVSGNFSVLGTTTTLNTATLQVEDKNITLNYGTGDTSGSADGAGITIQDAINGTTDATILWGAADDRFNFSHMVNVETGGIRSTGSTNDGNAYSGIFRRANGSNSLLIRNDGVVIVPSSYLYVSSTQGAYVEADLRVRGSLSNDTSGESLKIADNTHITGTIFLGATSTASDQLAVNNGTDIFLGTSSKGLRTYKDLHTNSGNNKYWHAGNDGSGSGLDADLLDGQHGSYYLNAGNINAGTLPEARLPTISKYVRSDTGDSLAGNTYLFTRTSTSPAMDISGHAGAGSYNYFLRARNDGGIKAVMFVNGSTRSSDGGANAFTIRNDGGPFILGNSAQSTRLVGTGDLTYNGNEVWHAGNDGTGSGLDADTLDGQQGSYYAPVAGSTSFRPVTAGLYGTGHGGSTLPIWQYNASHPGYGIGYTEGSPDSIRLDVSNNLISGTPDFEVSENVAKVNGNTVWHGGNDGTGSGLDADTVDGIQAASFLRSDATDTATGKITLQYGETSDLNSIGGSRGVTAFHTANVGQTSNRPDSGNYATGLEFTYYDASARSQLAAGSTGSNNQANFYVRSEAWSATNSWTSWYKLWHSGNDGTGSGLDADTVDGLQSGSFLRSDTADTATGQLTFSNKRANFGASGFDGVGFSNNTNLHMQNHNQFWIGAGNGTWFTGTANSKSQASGLAADVNKAHDLLITTMQATSSYDRGITFAVDSNGAGTAGWRLGKWHSGDARDASKLVVDGTIFAKGGHTDEYDYYGDDYSTYYSSQGGIGWTGDGGVWNVPGIVSSTALQIQSSNYTSSTRKPQLQFHQYGYGGIAFEYDGPNDTLNIIGNSSRLSNTGFKQQGNTIWHAGNDGSGSGLDADTVDGKHKDFLMHYKGQVSGNWDTIFSQTDGHMGVYEVHNISNTDSNYPSGAYTYGGVLSWQLDNSTFKMYAPHTGSLYIQNGWNNDEYSGWRKVWDSGNDGANSGLDADLLDGQHGSYYRSASNLNTGTLPVDRLDGTVFRSRGSVNVNTTSDGSQHNPFDDAHTETRVSEYGTRLISYTGASATMMTIATGGSASVFQIGAHYNGDDFYMRVRTDSSNWRNWRKLWHNGNDGTGSGLDADTVDSLQASSFLRSDADDTATGKLYFTGGSSTVPALHIKSGGNNWSEGMATHPLSDSGYALGFYRTKASFTDSTNTWAIGNLGGSGYQNYFGLLRKGLTGGVADRSSDALFTVSPSGTFKFGFNPSVGSNTIWHAGNDGPGSGLDADTVDGIQGSSIVTLAGTQTITGTKTFDGSSSAPWRLHVSNANGSWDALTFQSTTEWGDGTTQYGVLGGDGTEGLMMRRPHVVWHSGAGAADIRLGRSGGTSSGKWVGMGVKANNLGFLSMESTNVLTWDTNQNITIPNGTLAVSGAITRAGNTVWDSGNDGSGSGLDADTVDGYQYTNHEGVVDYEAFLVYGDTDKYYPVVITGGAPHSSDFKIWRAYGEHGPDDWNTSTHKGGLTFQYRISGSSGWGGYPNRIKVLEAEEIYTTLLGGINYTAHTMKHVVWLRGGGTNGARYHISSASNFSLAIYTDTSSGYTNGSGWLVYDSSNNTYDVYLDYRTLSDRNNSIEGEVYNTMPVTYGTAKVRHVLGGTQPSKTYWNSSNDGPNSGLDADTVDGQHASSFIDTSSSSQTKAGSLTIQGTTTLGNQSGDSTHINDTLFLGATDSGDSHFYFGENSSNWYGEHWYWDSGHTTNRYSRHAGTDTLIEKHDTRYTHKLQVNRAYERLSHSTGYQIGSYNSVGGNSNNSNPIYVIGDSYRPSDSALGNMYGIGYSHPNLWGSDKTSDWGMYVANSGGVNATIGAGAITAWFQNDVKISTTGALRTNRYENTDGDFMFRWGTNSGTSGIVNFADSTSDPSSVGIGTGATTRGITWGQRTDNNPYYMIYPRYYNNNNSSHSRLVLGWHTGVEIGASPTYGGTRFFNDAPFNGSEIMSVGRGDNHVRIGNSLYVSGKESRFGSSSHWDSVGFGYQTNVHFQGHNQFWIGAGNGTWFAGAANSRSQATGLAPDGGSAHDLLLTTMQGTSSYDRGITFGVDTNGAGTAGWRLGKWHSGDARDSSKLVVDGQIFAKGGNTDEYDYYANDYSAYYSSQGGTSHWTGDGGWQTPGIVSSTAIQIQSSNYTSSTRTPQLQFHQYGYGGIVQEYDGPNKIFHIKQTGTNDRLRYAQITTHHGILQLGAMNSSYCHIYTNRPAFYFNKTNLYADGNTILHEGNIQSAIGATAYKSWSGLNASGTQAKRYHIMRLYVCPAHWDSNHQNIKLFLHEESYESSYTEYHLWSDYNGGNQNTAVKLHVKDVGGNDHSRHRVVVGSPVSAGWNHSNQPTYYYDIYVEVAYYKQVRAYAHMRGHGYVTSNPTSGGATTVVYSSPTSSNVSDFTQNKQIYLQEDLSVNGSVEAGALSSHGSAAAPTYSFNVDSDSGMFSLANNAIGFATNGTQRLKINNNGLLITGTSGLHVNGSEIIDSNRRIKNITEGSESAPGLYFGSDSDTGLYAGSVSDVNALYVTSNGSQQQKWQNGVTKMYARVSLESTGNATANTPSMTSRQSSDGNGSTRYHINFVKQNGTTVLGRITTNNYATTYTETSDYRLKENVNYTWTATDRLKQLRPCQYNWISDPDDTTVDGFLAHEVADVAPQAVVGQKDAVDSEGNIDAQGLDNSKLVPLLVKTIQELEARIAALENS